MSQLARAEKATDDGWAQNYLAARGAALAQAK
jgi:hypothetical protein